jgi:hypothetical protein
MFNYADELAHSVNARNSLPLGDWMQKDVVLVRANNTLRVIVHFYYYLPWYTEHSAVPQIIDMMIVRDGWESPFYKDFINFDGAFRDELGRYSTDIADLVPFSDFDDLLVFEDESDPFVFSVSLNEEEQAVRGN